MKASRGSDCDVVVVGAGIAGLTAGALLSKAGLDVAVVEAQKNPGGYLAGFKRRKFVFDSSVVWLNQCGPGGLASKLLHHLAPPAPPECAPQRQIRRYRGDSFDYLLTSEPDELKSQLCRDFPRESAGLERFFKDAETLAQRWMLLRNRSRSTETMTKVERAAHGVKMLHWMLPLWRSFGVSTERGLRRYFEPGTIDRVFCTESQLMSILMPIAWAYAGDYQRPPVGGSQSFISWLGERLNDRGASLLLGQGVDRVLADRGGATGVVLESGERIRSRYVLAACDLETLYTRMVPPALVPSKLVRNLRQADLYPSHVTLYLGLDCEPDTLGLGEELLCYTRDDVTRQEQSAGDPRKAALNIVAPSLRSSSLAPAGRGTLMVQYASTIEHENHWRSGQGLVRGAAYGELKEEVTEILIERLERDLLPGLGQHIVVKEMATPLTYHRYTGNRHGSIMGTRPSGRNIRRHVARYSTPVERLFVAGHWADYGGGVPIAMKAAANASLLVLERTRPSAFRELRDVLDGKRVLQQV